MRLTIFFIYLIYSERSFSQISKVVVVDLGEFFLSVGNSFHQYCAKCVLIKLEIVTYNFILHLFFKTYQITMKSNIIIISTLLEKEVQVWKRIGLGCSCWLCIKSFEAFLRDLGGCFGAFFSQNGISNQYFCFFFWWEIGENCVFCLFSSFLLIFFFISGRVLNLV